MKPSARNTAVWPLTAAIPDVALPFVVILSAFDSEKVQIAYQRAV
jgi:hypothetical protein